MAGGSSIRWESDPLFSAAEVVQDSADRMESLYRMLVHDWKLVREENKDNKLLSSIQYHKRDLVTAVETTKWQLEDFERAVYFAALSDETGLRKNAISKHKQFIDAIREQIVLVEKCLEEISTGDSNRSMQWTNLNEPDAGGLALFLSGGDSMDHHLKYNSENSIMKRFFDSTGNTDEIIELEPEEEHLQEGVRENGCKMSDDVVTYNSDNGKTRQSSFSTNRMSRYFPRVLNSFWFLNKYRFSRNSTKRRKDGEITDDVVVDIDGHTKNISSSEQLPVDIDGRTKNISSTEQCKQAFSFDICQGLHCRGLSSAMQVHKWLDALPRRFGQSQGLSQHITFHMPQAFVVLVTLTILGLLVFSFS